jgi:pyruvate dehydrogenase E2 component (dihydrolipoamide acetyltransferase)
VGDVVGQMTVQGAALPRAGRRPWLHPLRPLHLWLLLLWPPPRGGSCGCSCAQPHRGAFGSAAPCIAFGAQVRSRTGRASGRSQGLGQQGPHHGEDIQSFTKSVMAGAVQTLAQQAVAPKSSGGNVGGLEVLAWPKVDFAKFGAVERKELSRIKKISGANLHRNWVVIPTSPTMTRPTSPSWKPSASTNAESAKAKSDVKVTMLAFVIKAVVAALKKFPEFNASLDGDTLVYKQYFNIGFAADTPNGLVVPVLKDADKKGILQISQEMGELAKKARDGKLGAADMQGGCFSISSLGGIGGTNFTPIINAPEVAILGLSKGAMKPVWDGKQFVPRLMLPLSCRTTTASSTAQLPHASTPIWALCWPTTAASCSKQLTGRPILRNRPAALI